MKVDGSKRQRRFSSEARRKWYAHYRTVRWAKAAFETGFKKAA